MLMVAVESYNLTAVIVQHDSPSTVVSAATALWLFLGFVAGAVFGGAGSLSRGPHAWLASVGSALGASVLYSEAAVRVRTTSNHRSGAQIALVEVAFGVIVAVVSGRTNHQRFVGLVISVPLTALGLLAFTGFGYGR